MPYIPNRNREMVQDIIRQLIMGKVQDAVGLNPYQEQMKAEREATQQRQLMDFMIRGREEGMVSGDVTPYARAAGTMGAPGEAAFQAVFGQPAMTDVFRPATVNYPGTPGGYAVNIPGQELANPQMPWPTSVEASKMRAINETMRGNQPPLGLFDMLGIKPPLTDEERAGGKTVEFAKNLQPLNEALQRTVASEAGPALTGKAWKPEQFQTPEMIHKAYSVPPEEYPIPPTAVLAHYNVGSPLATKLFNTYLGSRDVVDFEKLAPFLKPPTETKKGELTPAGKVSQSRLALMVATVSGRDPTDVHNAIKSDDWGGAYKGYSSGLNRIARIKHNSQLLNEAQQMGTDKKTQDAYAKMLAEDMHIPYIMPKENLGQKILRILSFSKSYTEQVDEIIKQTRGMDATETAAGEESPDEAKKRLLK